MNRYIKNLKAFLAEQSPRFGYDDANSILDMLYDYDSTEHPIDSGIIRCQFAQLSRILDQLSFEDHNTLFCKTVGLCEAHSRQAFPEGVQVGMRLFTELSVPE